MNYMNLSTYFKLSLSNKQLKIKLYLEYNILLPFSERFVTKMAVQTTYFSSIIYVQPKYILTPYHL